jgi:hypothetical protein
MIGQVAKKYRDQADEIIKDYFIRASSTGKLMGNLPGLTERQLSRMNELEKRNQDAKNGKAKPLTANMAGELKLLVDKHTESDVLPTGALTYCQQEADAILYGKYEDAHTKEMEKGEYCEQDSLELLSNVYSSMIKQPVFIEKNTRRYYKDCLSGEPDAIYGETVIDVKTSWSITPLIKHCLVNSR